MTSVPPLAKEALELARRGDTDGAIEAAGRAIDAHPDDCGLRLFLGLLHARRLELDAALPHLRKAVALAPDDPAPSVELVRLLIGLGRLDEAEQELGRSRLAGLEPRRLQGMILARRHRSGQAAQIFREVVAAEPADHESWGNLGASELACGRPRLAASAFEQAIRLRPDIAKFREKWIEAVVEAGEGEQALKDAREFARANAGSAEPQIAVATLEDLLGRPEQAVATLRASLGDHPRHLRSLVALARLAERQNRIDEFADLVGRIEQIDPNAAELPFLRAQLAFRQGDLDRALALAEAAPPAFGPASRFALLGAIHDRMGNSERAFEAFEAMNREGDLSAQVLARRSQALRDRIDRASQSMTAERVRSWSADKAAPDEALPAFLIGFPRSGTTLLDTFLMGHPDICVAEEMPMLESVARQLGDSDSVALLDEADPAVLRARYFATAAEHLPGFGKRLLVDKYPLGAIDAPLIHRLFPSARIIFALRHPCDVVLSCFLTPFQPNPSLVSFSNLEDAAKLYDKVMGLWAHCRAVMPLDVHEIRYEQLVADPEGQLRPLLAFLDLPWDDAVLGHEQAAKSRSFIGSASYAQVVQPLYDRSIGRWKRYARQMEPVLPLLEPWAAKFGYDA